MAVKRKAAKPRSRGAAKRKRNVIPLLETIVSGAATQAGASALLGSFKGKKKKKPKSRKRNALFGPFVREMKSRERASIAARFAPAKAKSKSKARPKSAAPSSGVISEVASALKNLGYGSRSKSIAESAARKAGSGAGFDAVFRAAMSKSNPKLKPGELLKLLEKARNPKRSLVERITARAKKPPLTQKQYERLRFSYRKGALGSAKLKENVRRKKRNPSTAATKAAQLYKDFHGTDSTGYDEYQETIRERGNLAELGRLMELWLNDDSQFAKNRPENKAGDGDLLIEFPTAAPRVAADPDGDQLFLVGGDQNLDGQLRALGITSKKDIYDLGPVKAIVYHTRKKFDNFDPVDYFHYFGEESKRVEHRPHLLYDRLNKRLLFAGGAYKAKPEGIVN